MKTKSGRPKYTRIGKFKFLHNKEGKLHSFDDLPALVFPDGTKRWYKEDKIHRDNDLPAIIHPDGTKYWCKDDVMYTPAAELKQNEN